jgi:hypothetical protein
MAMVLLNLPTALVLLSLPTAPALVLHKSSKSQRSSSMSSKSLSLSYSLLMVPGLLFGT